MEFYKSLVNPPMVIFTTAYPEYALEGFEVEAIDYLLKPFGYSRFLKAVNKAEKQLKTPATEKDEFVTLKADKKTYRINIEDIIRLESVGDYVKVFFLDKSILVHDTMQKLLNKFPAELILRVHKSHAINAKKVESIEGNIIHLDEIKIPIGATYKNDVIKELGF